MSSNNPNTIFTKLNLVEYERNLYAVDTPFTDNQLEYYRIQAGIVNADYFYCFNSLIDNNPIPFIYIYDQRINTPHDCLNLVDINRQLWTLGEIALAIIVYDDGFKIIDTRNPIKSDSEPAFLDGLSITIKEIDSALKHRIFEGSILEESPADYVSVSPYQKLLDHIENEILKKSKTIGCRPDLLKKLLVKFILIRYLEEQIDSSGNSVFERDFFSKFISNGTTSTLFQDKSTFCDVLRGKKITDLLKFLNDKFNGGIFNISEEEEIQLGNADLKIIADALDGGIDLHGQMSIWKYYDFNLLPIEFISRLYERFVTSVDGKQKSTGAYYTPPHLARLLVDELLPFDMEIDFRDFKILDPSCGSGIFLVLAYKRLITLWMLKNNKQAIEGEEDIRNIKTILSDCIFGVDINEDALSITATSLQIELSSHIRPKEIWESLTFDNLEAQGNLVNLGFFKWYKRTGSRFDIIAGNPPFNISPSEVASNLESGQDDDFSEEKYLDYNMKLQAFPDNNPALIFLHRCLDSLLKDEIGILFMVMPASRFLYTSKSFEYKKSLVSKWNLQRIYDFTPLREHLWGKTKIATIAVKINNSPIANSAIEHIIVRNSSANERGAIGFQIDKYDKFNIPVSFVFSKKSIWKINLLGGGRLGFFIDQFNQYPTIKDYFDENGFSANIGYTRDKYVINEQKHRDEGQVVNLQGKAILNAELFNSDAISGDAIVIGESEDWVRIPKNGFMPPNILIRLNINVNLPVSYNTKSLMIPNGVVTIHAWDKERMREFVARFKENRKLYIFLIKALSPKAYIQQGGGYSINLQDITKLPVNIDSNGHIMPFRNFDMQERILIEETELIAASLNKSNGEIFKTIDRSVLERYAATFCEILNLTYEQNKYKFQTVRLVVANEYVWVTFEHTNKDISPEQDFNDGSKREFDKILLDDKTSNSLIINKIITYYGNNNQISFIKPNKLKYWMRNVAYRDVENVKSEMFINGY